jgi:hypothetical protein
MAAVALAYVADVFLPWLPRRVEAVSLTPLSGVETSWAIWLSFFTGAVPRHFWCSMRITRSPMALGSPCR